MVTAYFVFFLLVLEGNDQYYNIYVLVFPSSVVVCFHMCSSIVTVQVDDIDDLTFSNSTPTTSFPQSATYTTLLAITTCKQQLNKKYQQEYRSQKH